MVIDLKIEIVEFYRDGNDILIGFKQGKSVVYSSVPSNLSDSEAKQAGYEQVYQTFKYEKTLDAPSIDGSNMNTIEVFYPEVPKAKEIKIIGERIIEFKENQDVVTKEYVAEIIDQYGDKIDEDVEWIGVENGVLTVSNEQGYQNIEIKAKYNNIESSITVEVIPYNEQEFDNIAILKHEYNLLNNKVKALIDQLDMYEDVLTEIILLMHSDT